MEEQFTLLFRALENKNGALAENRVVDITNKFLEDLDQSDSEFYVLTVFNQEVGILKFIEKASIPSLQKTFDKAVKKAFELIYTLVKDFPILVRDYQLDIVRICRHISRVGPALTKVKALETIQMIFTTPNINPNPEIIDTIWDILKEKSKENSDTVYRKALKMMGILLQKYPESKTQAERELLVNEFIKSLSVSKKPSLHESTFQVITNFLNSTEIPENFVTVLFNKIREYTNPLVGRYDQHVKMVANRSALDLLSQHASLFSEQIFANCEDLEMDLLEWLKLENADNLKAGVAALDAFYKELGDVLRCRQGIEAQRVIERIIDELQMKVGRKTFKSNVMRVYIRGLGYMAGAVKAHFSWLAGNIFIMLKQQIEFHYELKSIDENKDLENLPDYLFALSNYIFVLPEIDRNQEIALQKVCVLMVRIFPRLSPMHHNLASDTFFLTLHIIYTKTGRDKLEEFLVEVIEGCMKWSCSHYVALEVETLLDDSSKFCTYKKFVPFWKGVLNWNALSKHRISEDERDLLKTILFDELIRTLFMLIEKLNINIQERNTESNYLDIQEVLEASKKSDYNIFVNLTDLYSALMQDLNIVLFKKWVLNFFQHITKKCAKHPLASGFYNLTSAALNLTDKLNYFTERRLSRPHVKSTHEALIKLVQNVLNNIREYKDYLLSSCVHTILAAPLCIINKIDADYSDLFIIAFTLARTDYPLGIKALATLEKWKKQKNIKPLLKKTLPLLDPILRTHSLLANKTETTVAKYRKNIRRRKIVVEAEPELLELQRKILCFLAQMDGEVCWEYVNANVKIESAVWSENQVLRFPLFADKINLHLDKLVPRVVEQALHCSDRKLKVNACELLHAMAMMMLGAYSISDSDELFKSITSAVITLAVDSDTTIQNLFSLLSKQMMHWYASDKQLGSKQTRMILEILLEAISNPNNAKIRDHAGLKLKEFVNWSKRARNNADNLNINEIIKKLKYFSTHPDNSKRLGAALIFNNIYAELREEEKFINLYWLELLNVFVINLASIPDRANDDCLKQVNKALDNVARVLNERHDIFNRTLDESKRPIPSGFHGNTMKDIRAFLIEKTQSLSVHCRKKCVDLYGKLFKVAEDINLSDYKHALNSHEDIAACKNIDEQLIWLNSLRCYIDGYIFANVNKSEALVVVNNYFKAGDFKFNFGTLTADKIEDFKHARSALVEDNLHLAKTLLEQNKTPATYFNENLNTFFIQCVFENRNYTQCENIQIKLKAILEILPQGLRQNFSLRAKAYVVKNFNSSNKTFLKGVTFLLKANILAGLNELTKNAVNDVCVSLLEGNTIKILHPSVQETQKLLLELALENQEEFICATKKLCNLTLYKNAETGEEVAFGLHFFHTFKPVLIKFIARNPNFDTFMSELLKINDLKTHHAFTSQIIAMVLKNLKQFSDATGKYLVGVYVGYWKHIENWFEGDLQRCVLGLQMVEQLAYLQSCGNKVLLDWVMKTFFSTLEDSYGNDVKFEFYNQRIYVLGVLVGSEENSIISDALKHIRSRHADLLKKQSTRTSTTLLIKTYFEAANYSKSSDILKEAMTIHVSHENDYDPKSQLESYFKNTDSVTQKNTLRCIYEILNNNVKLAQNFTILISKCEYEIFEGFYIGVIKELVTALENRDLVACLLLEAMFPRIDIDKIENKCCPITYELMNGQITSGNELFKQLLKTLGNVSKSDAPRDFQCYAYNTFAAMLSNTQKDPNVYKLLFARSGPTGDILWKQLVGDEANFNFDIRNNTTFSYKDVILKIRSENNNIPEGKYIESQNLFTSSLFEDIGRHDFTHATMLTEMDMQQPSCNLSIQLTNEDIDQHPCMGPVCGVIKHLYDQQILSLDAVIVPIRNVLLSDSTIKSAKVFLAKVVDNSRMFLKEHAERLVGPVMKVVADGCAGECINSFVADILEMLLTDWSDIGILEEDKTEISRVLEFLMKHVYSEFSEIFKNNLSFLKAFVEKYKDDIVVPTDSIMDQLKDCNNESENPKVIIHIINILLANNLEPWRESMSTFSRSLISFLGNKNKMVYRQCAETISLVLKYASENDTLASKLDRIIKLIKSEIGKITDIDKWAYCIEGLSKHYPEMCNEYLSKVLQRVTDTNMKTTEVFLQILMRCSKLSLSGDELMQLLDKSDEDVLVITLEMVKNFVETSQSEDIIPLVAKINMLSNSNNPRIRSGIYDVSIAAYQRFTSEPKIYNTSKNILLQGLVDTNAELQARILDFWLSIEELRSGSKEKLIYLLRNIYKPEIEDNFLGFSALIMLSNLQTNAREKLFHKPLHKCEFTPLELSTHWKAQHSSQIPLFTSSLSSQGDILATQTLNFEPTMNLQSQKNTLIEGGSSLLTATMRPFKNPNEYNISQKYKVFRKRFNKDKQDSSKFFAEKNVEKNFMEKNVRIEATKKRDRSVRIYRSYRQGDYPDIEIVREDVLNPLKELAKNDPLIARILFTLIFESIQTEGGDDFIKNSGLAIEEIFKKSSSYTAPLMATFLDIALKYKDSMKFDPREISKISQNSRLMSLGANLLEEYLLIFDPSEEGPSKRARYDFDNDSESVLWIKLAELYKEMDDWDVVRSIFTNKLKTSEKTLKAIEYEASEKWKLANTEYKSVILEDQDPDRRDFYFDSLFRTFSELSSWSELTKHTEEIVTGTNTWDALWEDEWNRKKLLPGYLKAKLRETNPEIRNAFFEKVSGDLKEQTRRLYLKDYHSEELAFLHLLQNKLTNSKAYLDAYINNFLQNWSCLNPLFSMLRGKDLISMRNALDIYIFIITQGETDSCKLLEASADDELISMTDCETRNFYRKEFARIFRENCNESQRHAIDEDLFKLDVNISEIALKKGNFDIARKYVKKYAHIAKNPEYGLDYVKCKLLVGKLHYLSFKNTDGDNLRDLKVGLTLTDTCVKNADTNLNPILKLESSLQFFKYANDLYKISTTSENNDNISSIYRQLQYNSIEELKTASEHSLTKALGICETIKEKSPEVISEIGNCYYHLASNACEANDVAFIRFTLKAMFYQSQKAVMMFPRLLNLEDLGCGVKKETFLSESSELPAWLFIKWIPQLLAFVDTNHVSCIAGIIIKIAEQYPYSIIYAYKLSKNQYKFEHDLKEESKELCQRLNEILDNPSLDEMLEALYCLVKPEIVLETALRELKKSLNVSTEAFKIAGKQIFEQLYPSNSHRGIRYKLLDKYKKPIEKLISGEQKTEKILAEITKFLDELKPNAHKMQEDYLECYSPWLENFSSNHFEQEIEIPGQYTGNGKPLVQYHVKIAGFDRHINVLASLRKPIRMKMLGSNTKEYIFLVKSGEDLRQDQRIQQMFKLINDILTHDSLCSRQKLRVVTFEVIPLKSDFGLIEWVDDTKKLIDFISSAMSKGDKERLSKLHDEYYTEISKSDPKKKFNAEHCYAQAALKYDKIKTEGLYKRLVDKVPQDALRKALYNISGDTESLFAIKQSFIKSYSMMCLSNWLLGIGDRHLSNILIALKTGEAVGIDFGMAFGTATQQLGVPELVPFRLTPQITNLTQPHGVSGAFKQTMIHVLKSLRSNKEVILATMNVFIQEPMMDWLADERIKGKGEWLPQQRIDAARRKLDGVNPCEVMVNEICNRDDSDELKRRYVELLRGEGSNFRAEVGKEGLSAEEQVKCLLDQATDANLLGRMYYGWEPYL